MRIRNCKLLPLPAMLAGAALLWAQAEKPPAPESFQRFFVHYSDRRTLFEKALNTVGLSNQSLGRSLAIVAGVSNYPNLPITQRELKPADVDMRRLVNYLKDQEFFDEIVVLRDDQLTYDNLMFFLQGYFPQRLQQFPKSRFLFAYSGHGIGDERSGYLLTSRATSFTDRYNAISLSVMRDLMDEIVSRGHHVLVLLNACFGGAFLKRPFGETTLLPLQPGAHAITAGGTRELAWHQPTIGPGSIFFEKLFAGLDGRADVFPANPDRTRGDGIVTVDELAAYLRQEVRFSTDEKQNPRFGDLSASGSKGGFFFLNRQRSVKAGIVPAFETSKARSLGPDTTSPVWEAVERYRNDAFEPARAMFLRAAEGGVPEAMLYLGEMYSLGRGVKQDTAAAAKWYRAAAGAGDPRGMNEMGRRHTTGDGVPRDWHEAYLWYKKAALAGSAEGMTHVGIAHRRGLGTDRNDSEAYSWFRKAAEAQNAEAMAELGAMYAEGTDAAPRDDRMAVDYLQNSAGAGAANGMRYLAVLYQKGQGVTKDERRAIGLLRKASDAGDTPAMVLLGQHYLTLDQLEAKRLFEQAANAGNPAALRELSGIYSQGSSKSDQETAGKLLLQAADGGDTESIRKLASQSERHNLPRAIRWYRQGAEQGDHLSIERLKVVAGSNPAFERTRQMELAKDFDSMAMSRDGRLVLLLRRNDRPLLWDAAEWKELRQIEAGHPRMAAFSPNAARLTFCYENGLVAVSDLAKDQPILDVKNTDAQTCQGIWFPTEDLVLVRDPKGTYRLSIPSGMMHREKNSQGEAATPDASITATHEASGNRLDIKERSTGRIIATLHQRTSFQRTWRINAAALTGDGRLLAARDEGAVRVMNLSSGQIVSTIPEGDDQFGFSPDGSLVTIYHGSALRLWDARTGELRQTILDCDSHTFRADGKLLLTRSGNQLSVWTAR